ncbi:MAG: ZIP family metal transporter [Bacteroidota bacterium]|nr:ZIP family metal transporter [Bacteroidota bacterium]
MIEYIEQYNPLLIAFLLGVFTWLFTALGASLVFLTRKINQIFLDGMLGIAGGVMIAASYFSLLAPAIEINQANNNPNTIKIAIGFIAGALFLFVLDKILPHLHLYQKEVQPEGIKTAWQKATLLTLAITLHNIPEGLSMGILLGGASLGIPEATINGALSLAIGLGIHNFPEGIIVALPLRKIGLSPKKSFLYGQASALVEPIASVIGVLFISFFTPILPYALAFAAGAMIFVVIEEIIPLTRLNKNTDIANIGFILGFALMMCLN